MFLALQSSRPQIHPHSQSQPRHHHHQVQNPQFQQQIRHVHTQAQPQPQPQIHKPAAAASTATFPPRSQIEAMPPHQTKPASHMPPPPAAGRVSARGGAALPVFDPATMHPVFFMNTWRRPPLAIAMPVNAGFHPVATGYVFGDAVRSGVGNIKGQWQGNTKL